MSLGKVTGSRDQYLQQGPAADGYPLLVEDSGTNTNPRKYESDYGFISASVAVVGPVGTPLWAVGLACVRNPSGVVANGRTITAITTVYTMEIRNPNAGAQTAWLESPIGTVITPVYELAANDTLVVDYIAGKTFGALDLFINGSIVAIECQLSGTEV